MARSTCFVLVCAASALAACDSRVRPIDGGAGGANTCVGCHGDATRDGDDLVRSAPPRSVLGGDGGAHLAHVTGGSFRAPLACAECHAVPTLREHADGDVTVSMGGLAAAGGATATWDAGSGTCSGVYCHGATLGGGPATAPPWSSTADLDCTSCHGAPPPAPHTSSSGCGACHAGYTQSSVDAATHLDGLVQSRGGHAAGYVEPAVHGRDANRVGLDACQACHGADLDGGSTGVSCNGCHGGTAWQTSCTFCHGTSPSGPASPPVDTQGRSATSNVSVGAHEAHVTTALTTPLACTVCHPDRAGSNVLTDAAHVDGDGRAEVVFGARAGAAASYARASDTSATCASTSCHGAGPIEWTGTTALGCASCHGAPPPAPHVSITSCGTCHAGYTATGVDPATHLNGRVEASSPHAAGYSSPTAHGYEVNRVGLASCKGCHGADLASCNVCHGGTAWQTSCTFCHGTSPSGPASPPVDTQGRSATTNVSVGVHAAHVGTTMAAPIACMECHPDRAGSNVAADAAHIDGDGIAEVAFGSLATVGGAPAVYTRVSATSATCASTYCHGRFTGGVNAGSGATPDWTSTAQVTCASCHGNPPSTDRHPTHTGSEFACSECHGHGGFDPAHVNGVENVALVAGTYSSATRTCSSFTCHGKIHSGGWGWW